MAKKKEDAAPAAEPTPADATAPAATKPEAPAAAAAAKPDGQAGAGGSRAGRSADRQARKRSPACRPAAARSSATT